MTARKPFGQLTNKQESVQSLKLELKYKERALQTLETKIHCKGDLSKFQYELQSLYQKHDELQENYDSILKENQVLGQIIDKMKDEKSKSQTGVDKKELEDAFIELNNDYESLKNKTQVTPCNHQDQIITLQQEVQSLQTQLMESHEKTRAYKDQFMAEVREGLRVKDSYKNLCEDNKVHVEFIASLERRIHDLESKAQDDIGKLHYRINELRLRTIQETSLLYQDGSKDLTMVRAELEEEQKTCKQLRERVKEVEGSRESLQVSLAVCRHSLIQATMRVEEEARRVIAVEKMRISDLGEIDRYKREAGYL